MLYKIAFTSQRFASIEEVSKALEVAVYLIHLREADIKYKLENLQFSEEIRERFKKEMEENKKARDIINALQAPVVIPI